MGDAYLPCHTNHAQVTAPELRQNIYRILDQVIHSGIPVEVVRKGTVVRLVPDKPPSKLDRLKKRNVFRGDIDDILTINRMEEWPERR